MNAKLFGISVIKKIEFDGFRFNICGGARKKWCRRVILQSNVTVPPRSEAVVPTKVVYNDLSCPASREQLWATEARMNGVQVSRAIIPDADVNVPVRLLNPRNAATGMRVGTVVADLEPTTMCSVDDDMEQTESDV